MRNRLLFIVGAIAQLVEQRTENPCVPGSIPGGTTYLLRKPILRNKVWLFFHFLPLPYQLFTISLQSLCMRKRLREKVNRNVADLLIISLPLQTKIK